MPSRQTVRVAVVIIVLTVAGVVAARMRRVKPAVAGEAQPAETAAPADAALALDATSPAGHAMFPLGMPPGIAAHHDDRSAAQSAALEHLRDLDQLRLAGNGALWGSSRFYRGGGSSGFGGHASAAGSMAAGGAGFGGGRASHSTTTSTTESTTSSTRSVTTPGVGKTTPTPPSSPSPSAPFPGASSSSAPSSSAPSSATAPSSAIVVAPPIFGSETTPIPNIAGDGATTPPQNAGNTTGPTGTTGSFGGGPGPGGSVPNNGGPSLSPTPEPASLLLILTGLVGVIGASRRRQRKP